MIHTSQRFYPDGDYNVYITDDNGKFISLDFNGVYPVGDSDRMILLDNTYFWSVGTTTENVRNEFERLMKMGRVK